MKKLRVPIDCKGLIKVSVPPMVDSATIPSLDIPWLQKLDWRIQGNARMESSNILNMSKWVVPTLTLHVSLVQVSFQISLLTSRQYGGLRS